MDSSVLETRPRLRCRASAYGVLPPKLTHSNRQNTPNVGCIFFTFSGCTAPQPSDAQAAMREEAWSAEVPVVRSV